MSKKIMVLVRFFRKETHRDDFLRGVLHMNRLSFFKTYYEQEGCNIGDVHEGASSWYQPGTITLTIKNNDTGEEHLIEDFAAPVVLGLTHHNDYHVYCMSSICSADDLSFESFEDKKSYMMLDVDKGDLGDYCAIVPAKEFIDRVDKALQLEVNTGNVAGHGLVEYFDPEIFSGSFEGDQAILRKRHGFSHQKEFRFFVYNGTSGSDPRAINVGDISDIAVSCYKRDFHKVLVIGQKE